MSPPEGSRQARGVLPRPADWVMSNPRATGLFVFVRLRAEIDVAGVTAWLEQVDVLIEELRGAFDEERRLATVAVGFGRSFFLTGEQPRFGPDVQVPLGLRQSAPRPSGESIEADVAFYVMAVSESVASRFLLGLWATRPDVVDVRVERGHQRDDGTDVFGFRDGLRNIPRAERADVALVDTDQLPDEAWWAHNGTYLAYMKIEQHLDTFDALDGAAQERIVGRARDGRRLDLPAESDPHSEPEFTQPTEPPTSSHVRKVGPRGPRDRNRIFRRGLPFVEVGTDGALRAGLHFVSFQASLDQFNVIFHRWMMNPEFPQPSPGQPDALFTHVTVERWGFFFVPPDTDEPIGTIMFRQPPGHRKPRLGRIAIRKRVLHPDGTEAMIDLGDLHFRVLDDATSAQVGADLVTDPAGHALSGDLPTGTTYRVEEVAPPAGLAGAPPQTVQLEAARVVLHFENTIAPGGGGYAP